MKNILLGLLSISLLSCNQTPEGVKEVHHSERKVITENAAVVDRELTADFKEYWNEGKAEISSYALSQSRYGELREGTAVMIFVTEPFDAVDQVKADVNKPENTPVLKLNTTREFVTGIYPYHIMSSTFLPLDKEHNAIKVASSIQEWCGQTYMQLNRDSDTYNTILLSYFQSEGTKKFNIDNQITENQLPLQLRLDPTKMPVGEIQVIPSLEYMRLKHVEARTYDAVAKLVNLPDGYLYSVKYPELGRTIAFKTENVFPYRILSWMDRYNDNGTPMVSTGTLKKTIKSAYWNKNSTADETLRDSLQL
jgi:hypothetical protein